MDSDGFYDELKREYYKNRSSWKKIIRYRKNVILSKYKYSHNALISAIYVPVDVTELSFFIMKVDSCIIDWNEYDDSKSLEEILLESREIPDRTFRI